MSQGFAYPACKKASRPNSTAKVSEISEHLQGYFSEIEAPRVEGSRVHELMDIVMVRILAVIAKAKGWEDIETYGLTKAGWSSF
jgi:hypothetical protein